MANLSMVSAAWENTKVVCGNHPGTAKPPAMELDPLGKVLKYVCPKCRRENCVPREDPCKNSLSLKEYEKILDHLADKMIEADENNEVAVLTHHQWKYKSIQFKVLEHNGDKFIVSALNKAVL